MMFLNYVDDKLEGVLQTKFASGKTEIVTFFDGEWVDGIHQVYKNGV